MTRSRGLAGTCLLGLLGGALLGCAANSDGGSSGSAGRAVIGAAGAETTTGLMGEGGTVAAAASANEGSVNGGSTSSDAGRDAGGPSGVSGRPQNIYLDELRVGQPGEPQHCLPRPLAVGEPNGENDGRTSCFVAEAKTAPCDCTQAGRGPLIPEALPPIRASMLSSGACGGASGLGCDTVCACEIVQVPGTARDQNTDLYACQNELTPRASINGYCLIDLTRMDLNGAFVPLGNPELVADCPQNTKRWLRFLGAGFPSAGATSFIGCAAMPLL